MKRILYGAVICTLSALTLIVLGYIFEFMINTFAWYNLIVPLFLVLFWIVGDTFIKNTQR